MKNRKIVNFSILVLLMAVMVINNLEGMHTFKTVVNSLAILTLSVIGIVYAIQYTQNKKRVM
ncbi:hypothetical protein ACFQO8_12025 [Exiguobacterium aestuarii]|uniref:Uncharacterized protein n=1 Tax=Exiguobacterium aestuarii TaxID=273527 RepID=A0ABW2PN30_9BACL|nr:MULTISPECIES: hypothetical protein [Exiguobacterium]MCT4786142.1 hypothetical protein [Exiguobacterium aestuarii]